MCMNARSPLPSQYCPRKRRPHTFPVVGALLFTLFLLSHAPPAAHAQATDGVISGTAADTQDAAVGNARITIRNVDNGNSRTVVSAPDGRYRIPAVATGTYELNAEHEGFSNIEVKGIVITVGQEYINDLKFSPGSVAQSVEVSAQELAVDVTNNEVGSAVIQQDQVENLPITGRQATQLSLLLPATGTDSTRAQRPDANVGLGDQNVAATNYLVDGLTNMISGAGDPRDNIQQASIQEFKVITSQAPAEYGGRSGGVVSLVTKSGTNNFHGEAFEFFRGHSINRVDYYTQRQHDSNPTLYPIEPFSRNQWGGAAGGPILKDRLHYFGSFERLDDHEYFTVSPGGTAAPTAVLNGQTVLAYGSQQGSFRSGSLQNSYFGRLDWQVNEKHTAFLKFFEQTPSVFYCLGCTGGNSSNFSTGDTAVPGWTWGAGETWVISPRVVNQFGAQVAQDWQSSLPSHFYQPSAGIVNNANFGLKYPANLPANTNIFAGGTTVFTFPSFKWGFYPGTQFHPFYQEAFDTISITRSAHTFEIGADILNQPRKTQASAAPLGTWTFNKDVYFNPTDPDFDWTSLANASPTKYTATFPTIPYINYNLESAWYAQDEWKLRPNLTINLGLRYDLQTKVWVNSLHAGLYPAPGLPPFVKFGGHGVYDNVAPRIGAAWDPRGGGKSVFRAGYGIVYTMNSNNIYGYETTALRQVSISVTKPSFPDPYNGKGYLNYISSTAPNVAVNDNRVSNPPVYTWSVGATRELTSDLALIVDGFYSKMTKFQITPNVNTPFESAPGVNITPLNRPYAAYGIITSVQANGNFNYKALTARLDKRYSHHFQATLSYTLAKQRDNYNNSGTWTDYYYPQEDQGQAAVDRRNMFVLSSYSKFPWGFTAGGIYTVRSSLPFYAITGTDNNNDGSITDYVPGTTKNQHNQANLLAEVNTWRVNSQHLAAIPASQIQSSFYNQLDIHINKNVHITERYNLQLIGQLFNVFGTDNFGGVGSSQQANATSSSFGTISSALPRQQGELAVRFVF
jgi:hypothetical protein